MKKKIILGLLVLVVLMFFIASSWALDWERARQQYFERPDQEFDRVKVTPQTTDSYPSFIKFILLPGTQNLPTLIFIEKSTNLDQPEAGNPVSSTTNTVAKKVNKTR